MMDDLRSLYQEVIIDHSRNPRNFGGLDGANCAADGVNPLCGDELRVECQLGEDNVIQNIRFIGKGCAISLASASIMTEMLKGKTRAEAEKIFATFRSSVTGDGETIAPELGKLEVLGGVRDFPTRVKCATLAWHTAMSAITRSGEQVTTE